MKYFFKIIWWFAVLVAILAFLKNRAGALEWFEEEGRNDTADEYSEEAGNSEETENPEETGLTLAGKVFLSGEFLDHDILKISALAEGMQTPVLGLAFHLKYDDKKLNFLRYDPGNFLERGGDPFYLVSNSAAEVIFGETLRRDDSFPIDGGDIAYFYFQEIDPSQEKYTFEFINGVVSTLDVVRQDISGIAFEGFTLDKNSINSASDDDINNELASSVLESGGYGFGFYAAIFLGLCSFVIIFFAMRKICTF